MKVLWIIDRLDGSTTISETEEKTEPTIGVSTLIDHISVTIGSRVPNPLSGEADNYDAVFAASEK